MREYACPACGGAVPFATETTLSAVCSYCRSLVVRDDVDVKALGKVAALQDDVTLLAIGVTGKYAGKDFRIVGRLRWGYDDGFWNEWALHFPGGGAPGRDPTTGWLAEAQGLLAVLGEVEAPETNYASATVGERRGIAGTLLRVDDVKRADLVGAEGELPLRIAPGARKLSVDLVGPGGRYGCLEHEGSEHSAYLGAYVEPDDLRLEGLLGGASATKRGAKIAPARAAVEGLARTLTCGNCGAAVVLRAQGLSLTAVCGACKSLLDAAEPTLARLADAHAAQTVTPRLPIGSFGKLDGREWQVIGFLQRSTLEGDASWREYLLFVPLVGFAWLTEESGHWHFVRLVKDEPDELPGRAALGRVSYRRLQSGSNEVTYVEGEFYWRVRLGDKASSIDFIAPPLILSQESMADETSWSAGRYLEPREVAAAFAPKQPLPERVGVGAAQPSPYEAAWGAVRKVFYAAALVALVIQMRACAGGETANVARVEGAFKPGVAEQTTVSDPFEVKGPANLQVRVDSNVDNQWIAFGVTLEQEGTGELREVELESSYFHGYDEDGSWSEGSTSASELFPALPSGTYRLIVEPDAPEAKTELTWHLDAARAAPVAEPLWWALAALGLYPLWLRRQAAAFEAKRGGGDDDDDDDDSVSGGDDDDDD
jgi:hypothetical protein